MGSAGEAPVQTPRRLGRSVVAIVAGIVAGIVLSLGSDIVMMAIGILPRLGQPATDGPLLLATGYRTLYGILASYLAARLAPGSPMTHAMIVGAIAFLASLAGAVTTWNHQPPLGPHWYPVALVVLALPAAWAGGRFREKQLRK